MQIVCVSIKRVDLYALKRGVVNAINVYGQWDGEGHDLGRMNY